MAACQACEKDGEGRRTRCPECNRLAGKCCWDPYDHKCAKCRDHDRPEDPEDVAAHLKRIENRRTVLGQAIAVYEKACCAFWEGDYSKEALESWDVPSDAPSVPQAFDALVLVIRQACEDLGTPEELVTFPTIEFPGFCEDGSVDYGRGDIEALEIGVASAVAVEESDLPL